MNLVKSLDRRPAGGVIDLGHSKIVYAVSCCHLSIPSQPHTQDYRTGDGDGDDVNSNNTRQLTIASIPEPIVRATGLLLHRPQQCGSSSSTCVNEMSYMQHTDLHGRKVAISRSRCTNSVANTVTVAHNVQCL